jgi:phosphopantetheinyl transferase (holo-ACP synthase)
MCRYGAQHRLVVVLRDPGTAPSFGRARRLSDERAGARARRLALAACGVAAAHARVSVSHTEGSAAVLAGAGERMIGVDLVMVARVTARHAGAILTPRDWTALEAIPPPLRRAVGWALKEAAAKATGAAQHYFPTGIRLLADGASGLPCAQLADDTLTTFDSDWLTLGGFLCAVVRAQDRCNARALRECTPTLVKMRSP